MLDITVIILTKDEKLHIQRCIENVRSVAKRILIIDSHSTDGTQNIARSLGADVVEHNWPGNQAAQFNWAIDNIPIDTEWILRLDADEYLTPELITELHDLIPNAPKNIGALVLPLGRAFMGRVLKHGIVNGISMIRMFRKGCARYEERIMDEHLKVTSGETHTCKGKFVDDNRMPLSFFIEKHNKYAAKEAALLCLGEIEQADDNGDYADVVKAKRKQKAGYAKLPLFWRSTAYFFYRYFLKLGFLDGKEGFMWDFFQGLWYRMLVDAKVYEIKQKCGDDTNKIRRLLETEYNIHL